MPLEVSNMTQCEEKETLFKFSETSALKFYLSQKIGIVKEKFAFSEVFINLYFLVLFKILKLSDPHQST